MDSRACEQEMLDPGQKSGDIFLFEREDMHGSVYSWGLTFHLGDGRWIVMFFLQHQSVLLKQCGSSGANLKVTRNIE